MVLNLKNHKYLLLALFLILLVVLVRAQNRSSCTITAAILNTPQVNGSTVNLTWTNGQNSKTAYLNVSSSESLKPDGSFLEVANIVTDVVTDKTSYSKSALKQGTYYWNIVSDGCGQRKVSGLSSFTVQPIDNINCEIEPAVLDTPVIKDSKVTLSWTNNQNVEAAYINISTSNILNADGVLQKVDISNDVVTGNTSFIKESLSPGTYYWNIASDGCGQREISELGTFTIQ